MTMVLKLPLTRAASAKGLERKSGLAFAPGEDGREAGPVDLSRDMVLRPLPVGAGDRPDRGPRLVLRL